MIKTVWLRLAARATCSHLTPGVFIRTTKMLGFLKKTENFPWSVFQCNILSSAPRVTDWFTGEKRKGKRFQVLWGFFQWCISFAAVSLIYSKCGETLLTKQCWISQKIWDGSFGVSSYHLQCCQSDNLSYFRFQSIQFIYSVMVTWTNCFNGICQGASLM